MGSSTSTALRSSGLRRRAHELALLAERVEATAVMHLSGALVCHVVDTDRRSLCTRLLDANLRQLHAAADDLRLTAFRLRERAERDDDPAAA